MRHLVLCLCLAPLAAGAREGTVPDAPRGGAGRSAIEARIAEFNPCEPLGAEIAGFSFGVGQVRDVEVESANLSLDGDGISFRISGRLTCRGEGKPPEQDLSADVLISLEGILSTCEIKGSKVNSPTPKGRWPGPSAWPHR